MKDETSFFEISVNPTERIARVRFHNYWPQDIQEMTFYDSIVHVLARYAPTRPKWEDRRDINGLNWSYEFTWARKTSNIKADM